MAKLRMPDVPAGSVREFFVALHRLHHENGWPSTRKIARELGCSHTHVANAFTQPKLPTWEMVDVLVEALHGDEAEMKRLWLRASTAEADSAGPALSCWLRPPDLTPFLFGRDEHMQTMTELVQQSRVVLVGGIGGIGKTALAWEFGTRLSGDFPDGRVFLELNGFASGMAPKSSFDALAELLRVVGFTETSISAMDMRQRMSAWQARTQRRRFLLVADNALDVDHVLPILPRSEEPVIVITSRNMLDIPSAARMEIGPLTAEPAVTMFVSVAGAEHCLDQDALHEVVRLCGYHPLQIRVQAARVPTKRTLAELITELRDLRGSSTSSLFGSFDLSYRDLDRRQRRLFRLLGVHPGPYLTIQSGARLLDLSAAQTLDVFDGLADRRMVRKRADFDTRDWLLAAFDTHDLLREYARSRAARDTETDAALSRLMAFYITALADCNIDWNQTTNDPTGAELDWVTVELPNIMALLHSSTAVTAETARLARALDWPLRRLGFLDHARRAAESAALICAQLGDHDGQAYAYWALGDIARAASDVDAAGRHYRRALTLYAMIGATPGQAHVLRGLGHIALAQGKLRAACRCFTRALRIDRHVCDEAAAAHSIFGLAETRFASGNLGLAAWHYAQALATYVELHRLVGKALALIGLGKVALARSALDEADRHFSNALEAAEHAGDRWRQGLAHIGLGDVAFARHDGTLARPAYTEAVEILRTTGHRGGCEYAQRQLDQIASWHE